MNDSLQLLIARHETFLLNVVNNTTIPAKKIKEAILYSLFPGGKRMRPLLVYLIGELLQVPYSTLDSIAAAIELTHCYSLVHDDLPAMDDDDYRRGKLSCHRAFDEATAILIGDGLQALAIECLFSLTRELSAEKIIAIAQVLVRASGVEGMVSGQSLDLTDLSTTSISENELITIHSLKTGKLIRACIEMVTLASNCTSEEQAALLQFADALGLLFQMQDDFLDHYSLTALGKGRSSDLANNKTTFASLYTKSALEGKISTLHNQTISYLACFNSDEVKMITSLLESLLIRLKK